MSKKKDENRKKAEEAEKQLLRLSDGRVLKPDLYKMTMMEWRQLLDPTEDPDKGDEIAARVLGMEVEEIQSLPYPDYRRAMQSIVRKASGPLEDPNSASESIED